MGILKLMDFIKNKFPSAIVFKSPSQYQNKVLTIDASNWIYQFLIKTQTIKGSAITTPTDKDGNQTGHLIGMMSRAVFCLQNKILPVWVFDGKPPQEKYLQLQRRKKNKDEAAVKMDEAEEEGQVFDLLKYSQRTIKITQKEKQYAKKLIRLMGLPVIESPSQAQPQCSQIVKSGLAFGTISEDMDTLAFGCPRLIRYFNKEQQKCSEIQLQKLLKQAELTYKQFVDFCILCGCDYSSRIRNVGPIKAFQFIKKYENIDRILQEITKDQKLRKRYTYEDQFNHFAARKIFISPEVKKVTKEQLQLGVFQQNQIISFLNQLQFSENRINNWLKKVHATKFFSP